MMKRLNTPIERCLHLLKRRSVHIALLLCVLLLAAPSPVSAKPREVKENIDSSDVKPNVPGSKKDFADDEYYDYKTKEDDSDQSENVFDRLWNSFWQHLFDGLSSADPNRGFNPWTILWIVILVGLIVLVILKVTKSGASTVFGKKSKEAEHVDARAEDVDIHAVDYDRGIADAIAKKDYRFAVRLWFLRSLKSLSEKELIQWKLDKTNSDYYYELTGKDLQKEFGEVSFAYDHVWYGEFPIDENSYRKTEFQFRTFNEKIKA